jgi:hypothetical protein
MKTVFDHIKHVQGKPHHIRKRVAFGIAGGVSAFFALVWLGANLATGAFAIQGSNFAMSTGQESVATTSSDGSTDQGLAGVGAAAALQSDTSAPAHIEIVDTTPVAPKKPVDQTTIPF